VQAQSVRREGDSGNRALKKNKFWITDGGGTRLLIKCDVAAIDVKLPNVTAMLRLYSGFAKQTILKNLVFMRLF